jgi:hypothetical protein
VSHLIGVEAKAGLPLLVRADAVIRDIFANVKKSLANSEPSTHGTKRKYRYVRYLFRFRDEADMHRVVASMFSFLFTAN